MNSLLSISRESLKERDSEGESPGKKCRRKRTTKHRRKPGKNKQDIEVIDIEAEVGEADLVEEIDQSPERPLEQEETIKDTPPAGDMPEKENCDPRPESRVSNKSPSRSSRPGSNVGMRPKTTGTRLQPSVRKPNISGSTKRTISRTSRKSRPQSVAAFREHEKDSESENESETTQTRTVLSDILDFGVDIFADQGWDTDLEVEAEDETKATFDGSLRNVYLESCKHHSVIPASYFLRHMEDTVLEMKHHGLGPEGTKPIAVALVSNTTVTKLNLSDNWLGTAGGNHVCEMLKENCYISDINLSENKLSLVFANKFIDVLKQNSTLTHVTLSGNDLDDQAAVPISEAMMNTTRLEYLNLSHNRFGESAGLLLGPAISENSSIKHLDLSWNSLSRKGAIAVANGIKNNVLMAKINLAWNGFGKDGAKAIGDALKINSCLEELDLSNNRITAEGAVLLGKGLNGNETLKVLKMGRNPMQTAGCYGICAAMLKSQNSILRMLDFSEILVNSDFRELQVKVKEMFPDLKIKTGGDGIPKKPKARVHPMVKLKNYIERNDLRLVDFFNKFDKDNSMSVTREEFAQGIEDTGLNFTKEEMETLVEDLDEDKDGCINYSELVLGHQDFTEKEKRMSTTIMNMKNNESGLWKHTAVA